ncbi:beta-lactamase family protein [Halobacillus salinarum]|uniref:Beta-lactamase family protein n=1 Tax=Halobacillus salinarum TaxID=2932257 RepID=A0ABY4EPU8_9BACI|nr:serine hydrolase domain-containing protein [Halobacillus salinarum]UOQ46395.1 beta-lactamase family protein [Halobacillus salinarum]
MSDKIDFSGVVYVKDDEEIRASSAFGFADRVEERPNTPDTRFGTASGCKLFTAIGICQLVEGGFIHFDTRLADCLPIEFPAFDKEITIHHLLTHTSGIPDYFDEEVMSDFEDLWKDYPVYRIQSLQDFLPLFQSGQMKFNPGERFHYNNAGYILLGLIIEAQTGRRFTEYIESEVFHKCTMTDSGYFRLDQLPKNTAIGYIDNQEKKTWRTNIYSIPILGGSDGGAFVTAPDMVKLWESLFACKLLNEKTTHQLLMPHVHVKGEIYYGYGIWMNQRNEDIYKYHVMGYDPGVSFRASFYPDSHLKIVIPSNNESGPFEMTKGLEDLLVR